MAQKLHNLSKWEPMTGALVFGNPEPRLVKIDVNCPVETAFYVERQVDDLEADPERRDDKVALRDSRPLIERTFLGIAKGRDQFEFNVEGAFELSADNPCWFFTVDSQRVATVIESPVIFTKVANRRARNHHLEMIEFQMKRNLDTRLGLMQAETDRRIAALTAGIESYATRRNETPAPKPGDEPVEGSEQEPGPGDTPPATGEAPPDGGKGGTGKGAAGKPAKAPSAGDDGGKASKAS